MRARRAVLLALSRAPSLRPRCRCDDCAASSSDRNSPRVGPLLGRRHRVRYPGRRAGELRSRRLCLRGVAAREYLPARAVRAPVAAFACYRRHAPHPPLAGTRPGKHQLRRRPLRLGPTVRNLPALHAGATPRASLRRARVAETRLPEAILDDPDTVAAGPGECNALTGLLP